MGGAPVAAEEAPAEEEEKVEQTEFDVKLQKVDAAGKIKVIKVSRSTHTVTLLCPLLPPALTTKSSMDTCGNVQEVRAATGLGLKEAKELVEGAPCVIKKALPKAEAEELAAKLKEVGGECSVE